MKNSKLLLKAGDDLVGDFLAGKEHTTEDRSHTGRAGDSGGSHAADVEAGEDFLGAVYDFLFSGSYVERALSDDSAGLGGQADAVLAGDGGGYLAVMAGAVHYDLCQDVQRVHVQALAEYGSPVYHHSADLAVLEDHVLYRVAVEDVRPGVYGVIEQGRGALNRVHGVEAVPVGGMVDLEVAHDVHGLLHASAGSQLAVELGHLEPGLGQIIGGYYARGASAYDGGVQLEAVLEFVEIARGRSRGAGC